MIYVYILYSILYNILYNKLYNILYNILYNMLYNILYNVLYNILYNMLYNILYYVTWLHPLCLSNHQTHSYNGQYWIKPSATDPPFQVGSNLISLINLF